MLLLLISFGWEEREGQRGCEGSNLSTDIESSDVCVPLLQSVWEPERIERGLTGLLENP